MCRTLTNRDSVIFFLVIATFAKRLEGKIAKLRYS